MSFFLELWNESLEKQVATGIVINASSAIMTTIIRDGFYPVLSEQSFEFDGEKFRYQPAERLSADFPRRVYWAKVPEPGQPWQVNFFIENVLNSDVSATAWGWPVGDTTSQEDWSGNNWIDANPFETRYTNLSTGREAYHTGADLNKAHDGDRGKPVYAVADGEVTFASFLDVWGNVIVIQHESAFTRYAHVQDMRVQKHDTVHKGMQIARIGQDALGGPFHLHFDVSLTQVLKERPGDWPGLDLPRLLENYTNPLNFIRNTRLSSAPSGQEVDMSVYFLPEAEKGDIIVSKNNRNESVERIQLQKEGNVSFMTRNQQWERRRIGTKHIFLEVNTATKDGDYFTVEGVWMPRFFTVGATFHRVEKVSFFHKADCTPVPHKPPYQNESDLIFVVQYADWLSPGQVLLNDVVELAWIQHGVVEESYWYAAGLGLVGWKNRWGSESYVVERVAQGHQLDNVREALPCLSD